jgi:hypothetical protein
VSYDSSPTSGGTTLLRVLWIPKYGQIVPEPEHAEAIPGETASISGTVPGAASCRWLEIWVDLPDGSGSGQLTLSVDGRTHSTQRLTRDVLWTSIVLP